MAEKRSFSSYANSFNNFVSLCKLLCAERMILQGKALDFSSLQNLCIVSIHNVCGTGNQEEITSILPAFAVHFWLPDGLERNFNSGISVHAEDFVRLLLLLCSAQDCVYPAGGNLNSTPIKGKLCGMIKPCKLNEFTYRAVYSM